MANRIGPEGGPSDAPRPQGEAASTRTSLNAAESSFKDTLDKAGKGGKEATSAVGPGEGRRSQGRHGRDGQEYRDPSRHAEGSRKGSAASGSGGDDLQGFVVGHPLLSPPPPVVRRLRVQVEGHRIPGAMVDRIVEQCTVGADLAGNSEVEFILRGDVLGGLRMRVVHLDGAVQVMFIAADADVRKYVDENLKELARRLAERKVPVGELEVLDRDEERRRRGRRWSEDPTEEPEG